MLDGFEGWGSKAEGKKKHFNFLGMSSYMERSALFAITEEGKDEVSYNTGNESSSEGHFVWEFQCWKSLESLVGQHRYSHSPAPAPRYLSFCSISTTRHIGRLFIARHPLSPPPPPAAGMLFGFPAASPGPRTALALGRPSANMCRGPNGCFERTGCPRLHRQGGGAGICILPRAQVRGQRTQGREPGRPEGRGR